MLPDLLQGLASLRARGHEVIVVDGGSNDGSVALARAGADRVLVETPGRARQMNRGAAVAQGEVLVFLHADSRLPSATDTLIRAALASAGAGWGWFDVRLSHPGWLYQLIAGSMNWRARLTRVCTGDQTLFVRRDLFERVGGFPAIALMEDVAMSKRLRRSGRPALPAAKVRASSRRWQENGVVSTVLFMWKLRLLYFIGVAPEKLLQQYYPERGKERGKERANEP